MRIVSLLRKSGFAAILCMLATETAWPTTLQWTDAQLADHIKGGWFAKCLASSLGLPYEMAAADQSAAVANATSADIATFCDNDDVYVSCAFFAPLSKLKNGANGIFTPTMQDYATSFSGTTSELWCGNLAARDALAGDIAPPYSGGWPLNGAVQTGDGCSGPAAEDIDWQIECQWIGFSTPGMPVSAVRIDSTAGHVVSYANGLYAGTFFNAAISIAPLFTDIHAIVKAARAAVPVQCDIGKAIDTLIWYHDNNPSKTYWDAMNWALGTSGNTAHIKTDGDVGSRNNAALVTIALLWGNGNVMTTINDAVKMGQDADCNAGDACAILGYLLGYSQLPQQWRTTYETASTSLNCVIFKDPWNVGWTFPMILDSTVAVAKKAIVQNGGSYANGTWTIPVQDVPLPLWFEEYGKAPQAISPVTSAGFEPHSAAIVTQVSPVQSLIYDLQGRQIATTDRTASALRGGARPAGAGIVIVKKEFADGSAGRVVLAVVK